MRLLLLFGLILLAASMGWGCAVAAARVFFFVFIVMFLIAVMCGDMNE